jgi:K+-sensing histidine kinase KdpD
LLLIRKAGQLLVTRAHHSGNRWELHFESSDPRWQHQTIIPSSDWSRDLNDDCGIHMIGLVQGVTTDPQPVSVAVERPAPRVKSTRLWQAHLWTCCMILAMVGLAGLQVGPYFYAGASAATAWTIGTFRSTVISTVGVLVASFFFYEPVFSFQVYAVADADYLMSLSIFGVLSSSLAALVRRAVCQCPAPWRYRFTTRGAKFCTLHQR